MATIPMPIGSRYGSLVIIDDTPIKKGTRYFYKCRCDCGTEKEIAGISLRNGHTKSCGCSRKNKNVIDLTDQTFGEWKVLERAGSYEDGTAMWKCQCSCGTIRNIKGTSLRAKETKSCGCKNYRSRKYDLTNQTFNKLTAIEPITIHYPSGDLPGWKCKCQCGNIINISTHALISNTIQSCGCIRSKGEYKIINLLANSNIDFETQYRVKINDTYKFFDFAIKDKNKNILYFIEYDGKQHFEETFFFSNSLQEIQKRDQEKNQYCKDNNIPLIRIPYTHYGKLSFEDLILNSSDFII